MSASLFIWVMVAGFLLHNLAMPVMSIRFEDQKTYYSPDPHAGSPPGGLSDINFCFCSLIIKLLLLKLNLPSTQFSCFP